MIVTEAPPKLVIGLEFLPFSGTGQMEGVWDAERREANQVQMLRSTQRSRNSMRSSSRTPELFMSLMENRTASKNSLLFMGCRRHVGDCGIGGDAEQVLPRSIPHNCFIVVDKGR